MNPSIRGPLLAATCLLLSACATIPADRRQPCAPQAAVPAIAVDPETGVRSARISVLIYNVEGLPWPARANRGYRLDEIGRRLAIMREAGRAPDILLLQEAFTTRALRIAETAGYASIVHGPSRSNRTQREAGEPRPDLPGSAQRLRGERLGAMMGSGLVIATDLPILEGHSEPFLRRECAGFDCLANKGVMLARVHVPGVPAPLDIFNTHMNSRGSAGVAHARTHAAHRYQTDRAAAFIERVRDPAHPFIFGGDFNMRRTPSRAEHFFARTPYPIVHQYCIWQPGACDVRMSWDGDEPWMDTQDLQGFDDGTSVVVRPERVEAMFDEPWRGAPLADHDGFLVTYRLSWMEDVPVRQCAI